MTSRILYVDDDADIREIADMALGLDPSFDVRLAGSGRDGISIARDWSPNLILLDVMMPELDGPAVLEILRQDAGTLHIPIVFITARTQAQEIVKLQQMGARAVLAKPFDPMTLAEQVKELLHE